ncbi:hypothetical protein ABI125_06475 [Tamlana crocina]
MKLKLIMSAMVLGTVLWPCGSEKSNQDGMDAEQSETTDFEFKVDQFADVKILRYQVLGWEKLSLKEPKLVYYLTQAGLAGRDIMWGQNYRHNLKIKAALENIYTKYSGDKSAADWQTFETYLKRLWFNNGIHHHYSNDRLKPT